MKPTTLIATIAFVHAAIVTLVLAVGVAAAAPEASDSIHMPSVIEEGIGVQDVPAADGGNAFFLKRGFERGFDATLGSAA